MSSSKTLFVNWKKHRINYEKKQRFIYLPIKDKIHRLKMLRVALLEKINFDGWKTTFSRQIIDILWNSFIICLIIVCWNQGNAFLKGIAVTLFFILATSYLEDIKKVFEK